VKRLLTITVHALAVLGLLTLMIRCSSPALHYSSTPLKDEDGEVDYKQTKGYKTATSLGVQHHA